MKPVDVKSKTYINFSLENNYKNTRFKVGDYQNIKAFLQKVTFQIGLKKFLLLRKLKTLCLEHA